MSKSYNGHPSRNAWNVSLWVNGDEGLYRLAHDYCRNMTRADAAKAMLECLKDAGVTKTPDGAPYTVTNLKRAFVGY